MRSTAPQSCRAASCLAVALLFPATLAGCAGAASENGGSSFLDKLLASSPPTEARAAPAPPPEHHGCGSPSQCKAALKKMVDSPKRGWVGQQQAPAAYTDG